MSSIGDFFFFYDQASFRHASVTHILMRFSHVPHNMQYSFIFPFIIHNLFSYILQKYLLASLSFGHFLIFPWNLTLIRWTKHLTKYTLMLFIKKKLWIKSHSCETHACFHCASSLKTEEKEKHEQKLHILIQLNHFKTITTSMQLSIPRVYFSYYSALCFTAVAGYVSVIKSPYLLVTQCIECL